MVFAIPLGVTVRNLTIKDELDEIERAAERVGHAVEPEADETALKHSASRVASLPLGSTTNTATVSVVSDPRVSNPISVARSAELSLRGVAHISASLSPSGCTRQPASSAPPQRPPTSTHVCCAPGSCSRGSRSQQSAPPPHSRGG